MKYDVVVIGSGLGGLECACTLSRAGLDVVVLEQGAQPGGCLQAYRRRGLDYDTGLHYVGGLAEGQFLNRAFDTMNLLGLPWQRLDREFDRVTIGDRSFPFVQGYEDFADALAECFPSERDALKRYTALLRESSQREIEMLYPKAVKSDFLERQIETSAWDYLDATFKDPLLKDVLSGTSLKMELKRESLPLFTFLHSNSCFIESSWRLRGNGSMVADKLVESIRANGGTVICNSRVTSLEERDGKLVAAVCANGETYEADSFISNVHPAVTCGLVMGDGKIRPSYRRRMECAENTFGMFTVSLRLRPQELRYLNRNEYVYRGPGVWDFYEKEGPVGGMLVSCRVPEDESPYTTQVDLLTPMTWEKCTAWEDTTVNHRGEDYLSMKERMADECIELAEHVVPGLRSMTVERHTSTPLTYRDYLGTPHGSAFGMRKDCRNPLLTWLSPRTPISNLYLTGQSLMIHGVYGVTMTAFYTCAELLGKERIWELIEGRTGEDASPVCNWTETNGES